MEGVELGGECEGFQEWVRGRREEVEEEAGVEGGGEEGGDAVGGGAVGGGKFEDFGEEVGGGGEVAGGDKVGAF